MFLYFKIRFVFGFDVILRFDSIFGFDVYWILRFGSDSRFESLQSKYLDVTFLLGGTGTIFDLCHGLISVSWAKINWIFQTHRQGLLWGRNLSRVSGCVMGIFPVICHGLKKNVTGIKQYALEDFLSFFGGYRRGYPWKILNIKYQII